MAVDTTVTQASTLQFTSAQKPIALRVRPGFSGSNPDSGGDESRHDLSQSGTGKEDGIGDADSGHRGWKDSQLDPIV